MSKVRKYLKLIISICCFLTTTFLSCQGKYSSSEFANLIRDVKLHDFSSLLPLTDRKMKKILKTDDVALLCIALYLKEDEKLDEAKAMLQFASLNCKEPFSTIVKEKLYDFSNDEERISLLKDRIKEIEKDENEEKKQKLENDIKELLFFTGQFEELNDDVPNLFAKRAINHKVLLTYNLLSEDESNKDDDFHTIMKIRLSVYEKKYNTVYELAKKFLLEKPILISSSKYILYDFLRVFLFGSKEYAKNAKMLENFLQDEKLKKNQNYNMISYMTSLYIARLYEKAEREKDAIKYYNIAVKKALTPYDRDDSNWYKLNYELKNDFSLFIRDLKSSLPKWDNHYWYEDLVSSAIMKIMSEKKYNLLMQLYDVVSKTCLVEQKAKLQYLMARSGVIAPRYLENNYGAAYKDEHNLIYYTILSAYQLNAPIKDVLYKKRVKREANPLYSPEDAMKILKAYLNYGLYSHIYKEVVKIYPTITIDEAFELSKELRLQSLLPDSINLMQFVANSEGTVLNEEYLRAIYPRPFYKEVSKWAKEYNVPEYIMYALIRSESFFRPLVVSHAGAIGLSQLMPSTAKDIARSLKVSNYDVTNPDTNIRFGTYYLSRMLNRFDGRLMPSMCSYNAGPIAVSRWLKKNTIKEEDLFVETIPYNETRNYGKKLLSTACIYGFLYYGKTADEVIKEIYQDINPIQK